MFLFRFFWNVYRGISQVWEHPLFPRRPLALRHAEAIAKYLLECGEVRSIQLFGSVARRGFGDDIDMVAVVEPDFDLDFIQRIQEAEAANDAYVNTAVFRLSQACEILDLDQYGEIDDLQGSWPNYASRTPLDLFLFPQDWKSAKWLRYVLPCSDPNFLDNIAKDAVDFNPAKDRFNIGLRWLKKYPDYLRRRITNLYGTVHWRLRFRRIRSLQRKMRAKARATI